MAGPGFHAPGEELIGYANRSATRPHNRSDLRSPYVGNARLRHAGRHRQPALRHVIATKSSTYKLGLLRTLVLETAPGLIIERTDDCGHSIRGRRPVLVETTCPWCCTTACRAPVGPRRLGEGSVSIRLPTFGSALGSMRIGPSSSPAPSTTPAAISRRSAS